MRQSFHLLQAKCARRSSIGSVDSLPAVLGGITHRSASASCSQIISRHRISSSSERLRARIAEATAVLITSLGAIREGDRISQRARKYPARLLDAQSGMASADQLLSTQLPQSTIPLRCVGRWPASRMDARNAGDAQSHSLLYSQRSNSGCCESLSGRRSKAPRLTCIAYSRATHYHRIFTL